MLLISFFASCCLQLARARYNNEAEARDELSFRKGDIVTVLEKNYGAEGWWLCSLHDRQGIVPFNYIAELSDREKTIYLNNYSEPSSEEFKKELEEARKVVAGSPGMPLVAGQQLLQRVKSTLESCETYCAELLGHDPSRLDAEGVRYATVKLVDVGREAQAALRDLISMALDVLRTADRLQKSGEAPELCQQLKRFVVPIKNHHGDLSTALSELERGTDILTSRKSLPNIQSLISSVRIPVAEMTTCVLANAVMLFAHVPPTPTANYDEGIYSRINEPNSAQHTPLHSGSASTSHLRDLSGDSTDGQSAYPPPRSASCDLLDHDEDATPRRQQLVKRPSQIADIRISDRSPPREFVVVPPPAGRSGSDESVNSSTSNGSRHSTSSGGEHVMDGTLPRPGKQPTVVDVSGAQVAPGDLTESELTILAYYAERMETLIPSVTNAVEAFCRAISERQVPKQFVWHSKMVVVGAYKMVYVADTVFQKLSHTELRNHIVACSNRLVDSIKNIVEFTKIAAQQYPSVGAMKDMVESVSHLPPLALDLAESIKDAASLR